jgi:hypothetical protein
VLKDLLVHKERWAPKEHKVVKVLKVLSVHKEL